MLQNKSNSPKIAVRKVSREDDLILRIEVWTSAKNMRE